MAIRPSAARAVSADQAQVEEPSRRSGDPTPRPLLRELRASRGVARLSGPRNCANSDAHWEFRLHTKLGGVK